MGAACVVTHTLSQLSCSIAGFISFPWRAARIAPHSYGTVLDAPVYKSRDALVPLRHTLGARKLTTMEREWLANSGLPPQYRTHDAAQYQIAGQDPLARKKAHWSATHTGRYYVPGAVPPQPRLQLAQSSKRLDRQRQAVMTASKAQQKEQLYVDTQRKSDELAKRLQSSLGTKVISFVNPSASTSQQSTSAASLARSSLSLLDAPLTSIGYIPMDPKDMDIFATLDDDDDDNATGAADTLEQARREQLAIQSEGLLTPAFGESLQAFIKRRSKELNEATRERPFDEVCMDERVYLIRIIMRLWWPGAERMAGPGGVSKREHRRGTGR